MCDGHTPMATSQRTGVCRQFLVQLTAVALFSIPELPPMLTVAATFLWVHRKERKDESSIDLPQCRRPSVWGQHAATKKKTGFQHDTDSGWSDDTTNVK